VRYFDVYAEKVVRIWVCVSAMREVVGAREVIEEWTGNTKHDSEGGALLDLDLAMLIDEEKSRR
jgi:hypothetical protein